MGNVEAIARRQSYKPSQVLRRVRSGKIQCPQPGTILCEAKRHVIRGQTESPEFWENGMYVWCERCKRIALARVRFKDFDMDLTGERTSYALYLENVEPRRG